MSRGPRRKRGAFSLPAVRRDEIERHARYVGAADTGDFWRWLVAWRWHNGQNSRDPAGALKLAAERMGGSLSDGEADAILETADALRQRRTADKLAQFLGVTFPQRRALGITTIGSIDITKGTRTLLRKRKKRRYNEQRRRAQGARPRTEYAENSLMRTKPWEAEGMSRRTWYRKRRGTSPNPAIHGTSPNPALLSSGVHAPVPPQRKREAFRGGDCPQSTVLLTWRWVAARDKACSCRHNRLLPRDRCQEEARLWSREADARTSAMESRDGRSHPMFKPAAPA